MKTLMERLATMHFWEQKIKNWVWIIIRTVLICGISFVILYPIMTKVSIAFKDQIDMYDSTVLWIPKHFTLDNFKLVFSALNYTEVLISTILLSGGVMLLQTFSCMLAGYGFSRIKFRGSGILFAFVIFTIVVPPQTIMIPTYLQYKNFDVLGLISLMSGQSWNLINTYWPFLISSVLGMGLKTGLFVFIFRQFFRGIPREMEEAAFVDGAGTFTTFIRIIVPNAVPALVSVMLFSFVWQWNDSFFTSLFLTDPSVMSSMMASAGAQILNYIGIQSGGATADPLYLSLIQNTSVLLAILPLIVMYLFVQRHFVESMERSGIVG
ncbi:carbohydrate ABC transporter permease [Paenibacillus sp. LHD-117]|uniref:carbohydrate ABC transporter permease n=1 Tax=Paenibacillus sp. LHD-117 TaxID=3071412 RepID=UPI0027E07CAF|nr:carbohydrate ABC transporter permease [Paenibacillus sp. LHD-117]MDQ6418424.1 carbohydrate ABC transporter permease [Paenibacillus sp. LHD-117]